MSTLLNRLCRNRQQQTGRSLALVAIVALSLPVITACRDRSPSQPSNLPKESKMNALKVSKMTDGYEQRIGKIVFDESNNGTLTIEKNGAEGDQLRKVWDEMSQRSALEMQRAERSEADGKKVTKYMSYQIPKNDERYPAAVWSTLEHDHGYLVDKER